MVSHSDIAQRWATRVAGQTSRPLLNDGAANVNVARNTDRILSYGWWEMARLLRNARTGNPERFLINGDTYSVSTSRHQAAVRAAIAATGLPSIIVPYSVLEEAGIDRDTVIPIDVTDDRYVPQTITRSTPPDAYDWRDWHAVTLYSPTTGEPTGTRWEATVQRHILGESLLSATVSYRVRVKCERHAKLTCSQCPPRVRTRTRRARFLSGFDANESTPSYFFCELPRTSKARTVQDAYDDLKPATVKTAESAGRAVARQGDIFAVPVPTLDLRTLRRQGATVTRSAHILGTNHVATEVARIGNLTYARGILSHRPEGRRPDHRRVTLGNRRQWHLVLKNTVPVAA